MKVPVIPKIFLSDFIRGYFDGDGNVWVGDMHKDRKTRTKTMLLSFTSCSHSFLFELYNILKGLGVSGGSLRFSEDLQYSRLTYSTLDALKIYKIMYNGTTKLFLDRKRVVFERYIEFKVAAVAQR